MHGLLNVLYTIKIQTFRIRPTTIWYILEELGTRTVRVVKLGISITNWLKVIVHEWVYRIESYPQSSKHLSAIQGIARGEETKQLSVSLLQQKIQTLQITHHFINAQRVRVTS